MRGQRALEGCEGVVVRRQCPASFDEGPCAAVRIRHCREPSGQACGVAVTADCRVCLYQQRGDAKNLAHGAQPPVGGDPGLEQPHDLGEVVPAQRAEGACEGEVGGDLGRACLLHELRCPFELGACLVVFATRRVLPGQHLQRRGRVSHVAELGRQIDGLAGVGVSAGVITGLSPTVRGHGQGGHENAQGATVAGMGEPTFDEPDDLRRHTEPTGREEGENQVAGVVA